MDNFGGNYAVRSVVVDATEPASSEVCIASAPSPHLKRLRAPFTCACFTAATPDRVSWSPAYAQDLVPQVGNTASERLAELRGLVGRAAPGVNVHWANNLEDAAVVLRRGVTCVCLFLPSMVSRLSFRVAVSPRLPPGHTYSPLKVPGVAYRRYNVLTDESDQQWQVLSCVFGYDVCFGTNGMYGDLPRSTWRYTHRA